MNSKPPEDWRSSYIRSIIDSLKPNPKRIEELKEELKKQVAKSRLTLIKGGK